MKYKITIGIQITLILFMLLPVVSVAQTEVINGKTISGNVRWHGTKIIRGDVTVLPSARLVITPGTKILFAANSDAKKSGEDKTKSELIIKGVLIAQGELGNKITFSSESKSPRMGDWYGVVFHKVAEQSVLDYCIVEYAYDGITIKKSKIQVSNSEIRYNYHAGLTIEVKSTPKISGNIISENDYAGIICSLGSIPILTENLITSNSMGIVILSSSQPNLGRMKNGNNYNPGRNRIMQNEEYDIYNHSNKEIYAENNIWSSQRTRDIAQNIFDKNDEGKYGAIDYNPIFKEEAKTESVDNLLLLAQYNQNPNEPVVEQSETEETSAEDVEDLAVDSERANQAGVLNTSNNNQIKKDTIFNDKLVDSGQIESLSAAVVDNKTEPPILASSQPEAEVPITTSKKPVEQIDTTPQVDYNNIFLEAFLDGGKKEYIKKQSVKVNEIVRRTMQSGVVRVQVIVGRNGRVESAKVLRGFNDVLDNAALEAAKDFVYKPGKVSNRPVRFRTIEVFVFSS